MMNDFVEDFLTHINPQAALSTERVEILRGLLVRFVELAKFDTDDGDLRVAADALHELLDAAKVFSPWRDRRKLTVFGSARTKVDDPLYEMARALSHEMAQRGWMTISGAGPGIMEAAAKGAGLSNTIGVNIELPFEQSSNIYVDAQSSLVEMRFFFTRKVALTKESMAFAIFPGGIGTMDETFEIITLLHSGKSNPAPIVLIDSPQGNYWEEWLDFLEHSVIAAGYLEPRASSLFVICHDNESAITAIEQFYSNFVEFSTNGDRAELVVRHVPSAEQLAGLVELFPMFATGGGFTLDDRTIRFGFDGRNFVNLRLLIDAVNEWAP